MGCLMTQCKRGICRCGYHAARENITTCVLYYRHATSGHCCCGRLRRRLFMLATRRPRGHHAQTRHATRQDMRRTLPTRGRFCLHTAVPMPRRALRRRRANRHKLDRNIFVEKKNGSMASSESGGTNVVCRRPPNPRTEPGIPDFSHVARLRGVVAPLSTTIK